ncbi:hypothetical protein EMPS_04190 [Entomortierella parvispora]|uniref:Uncharacterized protein n=1 Tax=Entomortierella parvispora TaxID=205924 RepID=A0A9P3H8M8_9FUNG|nr:hypothetical protein EMPS_04190 [Entomortierella parvispora]
MTANPSCPSTPSQTLQKSAPQTESSRKKCSACLQRRPHHHHAEHQQQRLPQMTVAATANTSTLQQRSPEFSRRSSVSSLRSTGPHGTTITVNKAPCSPSPLRPSSRASLSHATPKSSQPSSRSSSMSRSCNSPSTSLADRPRWVGTWSAASSAFPSYSSSAYPPSPSAALNRQSPSSSLSSPVISSPKSVRRRQSMPTPNASYSSSASSPSCATSTTPSMRRASASKITQSRHGKPFSDKEAGRGRSLETGKRKEDQDRQDAARYKAAAARTARGQEILQGVSPQLLQPSCLPQPGQHEPTALSNEEADAESRAYQSNEEEVLVEVLVGDDEDHSGDSTFCHPSVTTTTTTSDTTSSRSSTPPPTLFPSPLRWSTTSTPTLAPALIRRFSCAEGSLGGPGSIAPPVVDPVQCQDPASKVQETSVGEASNFRRRPSLAVNQYSRDVSPARQLFPRLWDTQEPSFGPHNGEDGYTQEQRNADMLREQYQQQQQRRQSVGCLRDILVRKGSKASLLSSPFVGRSDTTGAAADHPLSPSTVLPSQAQTRTLSNCSSIESFPKMTRERVSSSSLRMQFIRDLFVATASSAVNSFSGSSETVPSEDAPQEKVDHSRRNSVSSNLTAASAITTHSSNSGSSGGSNGVFSPVLQRLPRLRIGTSGSMDSPLRSCVTSVASPSSTAPSINQSNNRNTSPTPSNTSSGCPSPILRLMKSITNLKGVSDNSAPTASPSNTQLPSQAVTRPGTEQSTQQDTLLLFGGEPSVLPKVTSEPSVSSELDLNWTLLKRQLQLQRHAARDDEDEDEDDEEEGVQQQGSAACANRPSHSLQQSQKSRVLLYHSEPLYSPTIVNEIWSSGNLKDAARKCCASGSGAVMTPDLVLFQNLYGENDSMARPELADGLSDEEESSSISSNNAAAAWTSWATIMQADRARWAESLARTAASTIQLKLNLNKEKLEPHQLALPPLLFSSSLGECVSDSHRRNDGDADYSLNGSLTIRDFYGIERTVDHNDVDNDDDDDDDDEESEAETVIREGSSCRYSVSPLVNAEKQDPYKISLRANVLGYSEKFYGAQSNGTFTVYS